MIDLSGRTAPRRRQGIEQMIDHFVAPSVRMLHRVSSVYPGIPTTLIPNGLDQEFESACAAVPVPQKVTRTTADRPLAVVAADLSDEVKVDRHLIEELARRGVHLLLVGDKAPLGGSHVQAAGVVRSRRALAGLLSRCSGLLVMSRAESFGLVLVEALAIGLPVLAPPSDSATELLRSVGGQPVPFDDLIDAATADLWRGYPRTCTPELLRRRATRLYSGASMLDSYLDVYRSVAT